MSSEMGTVSARELWRSLVTKYVKHVWNYNRLDYLSFLFHDQGHHGQILPMPRSTRSLLDLNTVCTENVGSLVHALTREKGQTTSIDWLIDWLINFIGNPTGL